MKTHEQIIEDNMTNDFNIEIQEWSFSDGWITAYLTRFDGTQKATITDEVREENDGRVCLEYVEALIERFEILRKIDWDDNTTSCEQEYRF